MSEKEYYNMLEKIVNDGRGYDAIVKMGIMLEHRNALLKEKFINESNKNGGVGEWAE